MDLAQERAESRALDAALDFARRAATQFSHAAQGSMRREVWFLLMAARAFARIVTDEQRRIRLLHLTEIDRERGDAFSIRLTKAVRTLDRDAFYAFEQWEALRRNRISGSEKDHADQLVHPINHYFEGSHAATLSRHAVRVIEEIVEGLKIEFAPANGSGVFRALPQRIRGWVNTAFELVKVRWKADEAAYVAAKDAWLSYPPRSARR